MKYAIIVDFSLNTGSTAEFLELIDRNAALSLRDEPGCERFDVLVSQAEPHRVLLYEIYADREAFGAHCESRHFRDFDQAARTLVREKKVVEFDLRSPRRA